MLYQDALPPVTVRGYAATFNITFQTDSGLKRIEPGAFDTARYPVFAALNHDPSCHLGRLGRGLRIWQDGHGLAFELAMPSNHLGLSVVMGVKRGLFRSASFSSPPDGIRSVRTVIEHGRAVSVIDRLRVDEISLVAAAANPEAVAWLDHETDADLPDDIRHARQQWLAGRPAPRARQPARITAHAGRPARPPQRVLAQIDAILRSAPAPLPAAMAATAKDRWR